MEARSKIEVGVLGIFAVLCAGMLLLIFTAGGCTRAVYMNPEAQSRFANYAESVEVWDESCQADPNTCAEGLHSVAAETKVWLSLVKGVDPNGVTP